MKGKITKNKVTGFVFIAGGIVWIFLTRQITVSANLHEPGPRLFPYIAGVGLLLCGVGLLFEKSDEKGKKYLTREGWIRFGKLTGLLIAYTVLMNFLGYFISTMICLFALILMLSGEKRSPIWLNLLVTVVFTGVVYILFTYGLHMLLPRGILF